MGTPESVQEVVSQRLSRLAPPTTDVLELSATIGSEFELGLLSSATDLDGPKLLRALEEAVGSGMIEELRSRGLAYRFSHELVRRALYDRLTGPRRAELHLRVGEALEAAAGQSGRALADLAHHFAAAAPLGGIGRGVDYNVRAAAAATASLAFDEAAERLRTALELGIEDPAQRAAAHLGLGLANHRAGGALVALEAFREAADIGRELGDAQLLTRAAIGYEEACWRPGLTDQGAVELLEEAAAELGTESSALRVGLLSGLARALVFRGEHERAVVAWTSAVTMARRLDDRTGLASVLVRSYWARGATSLAEILSMLTEARTIAEEIGEAELRAEATAWRIPALVMLFDLEEARREVAALRVMAERDAQPFMLHVADHYGAAIALSDGRLDEAEALARSSNEWSRLLTGRDASGVHGIQMFSIRREQGRLAELAPVVRILARDGGGANSWRPGLVAMLAELGMEAEARHELSIVHADGLDALRESLWLASLAYLTDACTALGDEATAELIYPELEPLAGTNVMIGHLVGCYGSADRYLGMLAGVLGEPTRAAEHFDRALKSNRSMGAATWVAHTAFEYARLLLREDEEHDRATALLTEADDLTSAIGMPALRGRIEALRPDPAEASLPDELSGREAEVLRLVSRGLSNREIGQELFISEHTAASHIRSILRKTDSANRTEAAGYAHRHGLADT